MIGNPRKGGCIATASRVQSFRLWRKLPIPEGAELKTLTCVCSKAAELVKGRQSFLDDRRLFRCGHVSDFLLLRTEGICFVVGVGAERCRVYQNINWMSRSGSYDDLLQFSKINDKFSNKDVSRFCYICCQWMSRRKCTSCESDVVNMPR